MEGKSWWIAELEWARMRGGAQREDQDAKARKSKWHAGGSQPCACVRASAAYHVSHLPPVRAGHEEALAPGATLRTLLLLALT